MENRNREVIDLFAELVRLTTLDEGGPASFRVRAYENAVRELEEFDGDLAELSEKELVALDGVGKSTAKKIREYFKTGRIDKVEKLRAKYPPEFVELTRIPGLGPKKVLALRDQLGIGNIDQLRVALENQSLRELEGFGSKTEENIAKAISRMGGLGKNQRRSIAETLPLAELFVERLLRVKGVERATYCGSLRRFRKTIGDIDIVAVTEDRGRVMDAFVAFDEVEEVVGRGDTKSSVIVGGGLQVDLRVVGHSQYGAAIMYFTGSKAHNIKLRQRAIARELTLNEYGLTRIDGGEVVASESEEEIYAALDMAWIPPPMREDHGEVEAAAAGTLPDVPAAEDVIGDWLVVSSNIGSDATFACSFVVGASEGGAADEHEEGLRAALCTLGSDVPEDCDAAFIDLRGAEGVSLTQLEALLDNDKVAGVVGGAGSREFGVDIDKVADALVRCDGVWIIDCSPDVLEPPADVLRRLREHGARFALGSGSTVGAARRYGPAHCQRAWLERGRLCNGWSVDEIRAWLGD